MKKDTRNQLVGAVVGYGLVAACPPAAVLLLPVVALGTMFANKKYKEAKADREAYDRAIGWTGDD